MSSASTPHDWPGLGAGEDFLDAELSLGKAAASGCWSSQGCAFPHRGPLGKLVDGIASKLAFFPPTPPSYTVEEHQDGTGELKIQPVDRNYQCMTRSQRGSVHVRWLSTAQGHAIISAFVPFHDGRGNKASTILLFSHGNAADLGQMLPVFEELGRLLRVNVMGYDYTGYGVCTGQPSVAATCHDISAVLQSLEADHGVKRHHVVLYGQSVGSGPTVWLASERPGVAGVILHSPLLSAVRVFNPNLKWWPAWADIFPNHLLVKKVIDVSAGIRLSELAPAAVPPLLAEGFDHQNIEACPDYLPRIKEFLAHVEAVAACKHSSDGPRQQPPPAAAAAWLSNRLYLHLFTLAAAMIMMIVLQFIRYGTGPGH